MIEPSVQLFYPKTIHSLVLISTNSWSILLKRDGYSLSDTGKLIMAFALMVILMLPFSGLNSIIPRQAFASISIVPSSDNWYGPGLMRVLITDTVQGSAGAYISPHIAIMRGSITLASADPRIRSPSTSGTFELFLTTSNPPFAPAFPSNPNDYVVGRISSNPHTQLRDFNLTLAPNDYLKDGDSVVVSYAGQSETIHFAKSIVRATIDRTVAGDGNRIILTLTDQNANIDPTKIDSLGADASILSVVSGSATMNFTGSRFMEEGQNSGSFDLVIAVTSATGLVVNPNNGATLKSVQFPSSAKMTLHGFDVYANTPPGATIPYDNATPDSQAASTQTVLLENSDAVLTIGDGSSNTTNPGVQMTVRTMPSVIREGDIVLISATIANNSTNVIQYSRMCSSSFSISFNPHVVTQSGPPCNIAAVLEQLHPGQSTTIRIPGFNGQFLEANQTGTVTALVHFHYQVVGRPDLTNEVMQPITFSVFAKEAKIGESFQLGYNQTVAVGLANFDIRFVNITEDSRCPSDVKCIWAGRAVVQIQLLHVPTGRDMGRFNLSESGSPGANSSVVANGFEITLQKVEPYPQSNSRLQLLDYVITLNVTGRNNIQAIAISPPAVAGGSQTGDKLVLTSDISHLSNGVQTFIVVFEVRYADSQITDFVGFANGTVSSHQTLSVVAPASWSPSIPGTYQARVFAIDDTALPSILSDLSVKEIIIKQ